MKLKKKQPTANLVNSELDSDIRKTASNADMETRNHSKYKYHSKSSKIQQIKRQKKFGRHLI